MSITEKMEHEMSLWATELNLANKFFATSRQEKIFEFLNKRENLCTPGFLLRRQLQVKFLELVNTAAKQADIKDYADLTENGNVEWSPKLIEYLAKLLVNTNFVRFGKSSLDIEKKQWQNYLLDKARCQRKTAIKLLFALEMDDATASKFLLANGNELLSLRNPFDYACKTCLDCELTYADAEDIFKNFSALGGHVEEKTSVVLADNFTQMIKNETVTFREKNIMSAEELKSNLLTAMLKYKNDFCETGYSQSNMRRLRVFLKYLIMLYPTVDCFIGKDLFDNREIEKNADGTPKILQHLVSSMFSAQEIDLPEYAELADYGGVNLLGRGVLKRFYDNIPFNRNILIPLKSLSQTLRAFMRAIEHPENAQAVNRETVLLLTYFFIAGWRDTDSMIKEKFQETLENDMSEVAEESAEESLLFALEDVAFAVDSIDESDEEPLNIYISALNRILVTFELNEFYAPFVLDRFILICLLSEERFLMNLVIYESHRLSKNLIEQREGGKNDGVQRAAPYE